MEAQLAWRVMADMFDDGSFFLESFLVLTLVKHCGMSKDEFRLHGVVSCQITVTNKTLDLGEKG